MSLNTLENSQGSSDYFGEEDSQFLSALETIVLPGDEPQAQPTKEPIVIEDDSETEESPPPPAQPGLKRRHSDIEQNQEQGQDEDIYGASHFGQFGEYMRRKRAKLQIQNQALEDKTTADTGTTTGIFQGIAIYINGWTRPSVQELRKLIVENGGVFQPYLDRKSTVTHIITCSLTPAKVKEFKSMKVVRPEWLTESVSAETLLPWQDYIFRPNERVETSQGQSTKQQTFSSSTIPPPETSTTTNPPDPLYVTDSTTEVDARRVPSYASSTSNPNAQRVMANPEWRKAHTSIAPDFIEGYYKNSRLHHLSTWKSELRSLVMEAQERAESRMSSTPEAYPRPILNGVSMRGEHLQAKTSPTKWKGKGKAITADPNDRVIMHCDFDCFFVTAGLVSRPEFKGKPVVVCHSQGAQGWGSSTSEIACCSYEARDFGIRNGMSLQQARKLCPAVVTIPYEFERYKEVSLKFYTVLMSFADDLQAVSVDEALIEVTNAVRAREEIFSMELGDNHGQDPAKVVAELIRDAVREATQCEVSIGIAHNILLARLATRRAKPANSHHLLLDELPAFIAPLEISDLHGFGYNTKQKALEKLGTCKLGDLANKSRSVLCDALGRTTGETLYNAIRGIDERQLESSKERKSVSCEINYGIRFENNDQAEKFIYQMAEEVKRRLDEVKMLGRMITLKIMKRDPTAPIEPPKFLGHGKCDTFNKQGKLVGFGGNAINDDKIIGEHAWRLLKSFNFDPKELRGIGIQIQKLEPLKSGSTSMQAVQSVLPFKKVEASVKGRHSSPQKSNRPLSKFPKAQETQIRIGSPTKSPSRADASATPKPEYVDLPSFSQVDMTVFEALPKALQEELEMEYKRRSGSPQGGGAGSSGALQRRQPSNPVRQASHPLRQTSYPTRNAIPSNCSGVLPQKPSGKGSNYRRIAQQLAPRHGNSIYGNKSLLRALGLDKPKPPPVRITEEGLRDLNIDPEVFAMLPVKIQREQLVRARLIKKDGNLPDAPTQRKILKPAKSFISPLRRRRRGPAPKAVFVQPPILRQQGKEKKEKLCYFETDDIQSVIEKWVTGYKHWAPKEKDIEFFSKYLVQCMESREGDMGLERAVAIMKWWLVLLRRVWEVFEDRDLETEPKDPNERAAVAWWKAFREVKRRLDEVARKRFGGKLSLK
ncbi:DNA repair protein rev1 [Leucoagaricus sp. SymC.cos]|nr:DNA repair protein rev1 [Leucoagaricus sp. SymC.cos]